MFAEPLALAQTRTITRNKLAAISVLDVASRALHAWRPKPPRPGVPRSFLVVEPWGIGDVVLSTVLLAALRQNFPKASITLLAKAHARKLLAGSNLVDEIIEFDFPWTAFSGKLKPSRYVADEFKELFRQLRARDFDVSLDARRDIRSNVITYLAGARRRIGYDFGGGSHLLTDVLPSGTQNDHKISDWLALLAPLGVRKRDGFLPSLTITESEEDTARHRLGALGFSTERPIIGVHPGASHRVRRWDPDRFATVIDRIVSDTDAQILLFEVEQGDSADVAPTRAVRRIQSDLRGFMALVTQCDLLLCNDSGPMHIASALGVPVTALFGPSKREWYGPSGVIDNMLQFEIECRPCFEACIFATPHCMEGISTDAVAEAVIAQLDRIESHVGEVARRG